MLLRTDQYMEICELHLSDAAYELVESFGTGRHKVHLKDPRTKLIVDIYNQDFLLSDITDRLLKLQCSCLSNLLQKLFSSQQLLASDLQRFSPAQPYSGVVPHFYRLPKLHKLGPLKIRPIISNYGIYCDSILVHLKTILNLLPTLKTSVKHSYELASILDDFQFRPSDILVSFDVQSLFTKVLVNETLAIVEKRLNALQENNG